MDDIINKLIEEELERANKKFPLFVSRHEAYAVMREELEEAQEDIESIDLRINKIYWKYCRKSKTIKSDTVLEQLTFIEVDIKEAIKELIQLGAMVKKSRKIEKIVDKV